MNCGQPNPVRPWEMNDKRKPKIWLQKVHSTADLPGIGTKREIDKSGGFYTAALKKTIKPSANA